MKRKILFLVSLCLAVPLYAAEEMQFTTFVSGGSGDFQMASYATLEVLNTENPVEGLGPYMSVRFGNTQASSGTIRFEGSGLTNSHFANLGNLQMVGSRTKNIPILVSNTRGSEFQISYSGASLTMQRGDSYLLGRTLLANTVSLESADAWHCVTAAGFDVCTPPTDSSHQAFLKVGGRLVLGSTQTLVEGMYVGQKLSIGPEDAPDFLYDQGAMTGSGSGVAYCFYNPGGGVSIFKCTNCKGDSGQQCIKS